MASVYNFFSSLDFSDKLCKYCLVVAGFKITASRGYPGSIANANPHHGWVAAQSFPKPLVTALRAGLTPSIILLSCVLAINLVTQRTAVLIGIGAVIASAVGAPPGYDCPAFPARPPPTTVSDLRPQDVRTQPQALYQH